MPALIQVWCWPGPRFNIKMTSYQYRKSHCGDKTILRPSYLHNGISYTGKMSSLYWIRAHATSHYLSQSWPCYMTPYGLNKPLHDGVIKWKHFPRHCPFVRAIHRSPVNSHLKGQWHGALIFSLSALEQTVEWTIETTVIWDAMALIMTSLEWQIKENRLLLNYETKSNHGILTQRLSLKIMDIPIAYYVVLFTA